MEPLDNTPAQPTPIAPAQEAAGISPEAAADLAAPTATNLAKDFVSGISWFYWIGGLSMVNIGMLYVADRKFIIGLGFADLFNALAQEGPGAGAWIAASVFVSVIFLVFGYLGRQGKSGFILAGLVLYVVDAVLLVVMQDYLSVLFHAYAGWSIFKGYKALRKILAAARPEATSPA